jgi:hypothetical protein
MSLTSFNKLFNVSEFRRQVCESKLFFGVRGVFALNATNLRGGPRGRWNQKYRVLTTILCFAEYLDRSMKNFLADLRA